MYSGEGRPHDAVGGRRQDVTRNEALARGRFKRVPSRWKTEFGQWIAEVGVVGIVSALAHDPDLRITKHSVYMWLGGRAPRAARAMALVKLSRGRLTLDAIYDHCREVRRTTPGPRKRAAASSDRYARAPLGDSRRDK